MDYKDLHRLDVSHEGKIIIACSGMLLGAKPLEGNEDLAIEILENMKRKGEEK